MNAKAKCVGMDREIEEYTRLVTSEAFAARQVVRLEREYKAAVATHRELSEKLVELRMQVLDQ